MKLARPIMDGSKVKWTLEQVEQSNPDRVRVDWLRFTIPVDKLVQHVERFEQVGACGRSVDDLWSWVAHHKASVHEAIHYSGLLPEQLRNQAVLTDACEFYVTPRALACLGNASLSRVVRHADGSPMFQFLSGHYAEDSGMDFYAARSPVIFEGAVVGYVLAGGKSVNQHNTVHFNLFGSACLHFGPDQLRAIADWVDQLGGWITRADLALDVWQGLDVVDVQRAWFDGAFDVRGKRPSQREHGAWSSGHSRTFEVGSRGTGKLLRAYEKGDELFGHEVADPWVRLEVEFRNNHRVLETDILRRPADFFAGAYPYLADYLASLDLGVSAARIPTHAQMGDKTALAAVERVVRWLNNTAGPVLSAVWNQGGDIVAQVIEATQHRPARRLRGFSRESIVRAFDQVAASIAPAPAPSLIGA